MTLSYNSCLITSQGWLELGNKQRATAATGMNDKSSRSHSVFTLVMTQTKVQPLSLFPLIFWVTGPVTYVSLVCVCVCVQTECVEGEEHDHRITSRINLVDLAGSERCNSAQTSGDRLRVIHTNYAIQYQFRAQFHVHLHIHRL